ncbi:ABC transporter [Devosia geojensis]|uniref:ABC transporter n=1 Tax=Devosia geojensis TaxID=443610 RepID=A0A0F5FQZ6_9HYPH|nr:sugar ABC transporter permease [Devosia geojensis]KKB11281.1 ABC transporter [Devosia geojensis]
MSNDTTRAGRAGAIAARAAPAAAETYKDGSQDSAVTGFALLLPAIALYAAFSLLPILVTIWISFTNSGGFNTQAEFVGFDNYLRATQDPIIWQSLLRTFLWLIYHVVLAGGLGLLMALAISAMSRGRVFFRTALFLPHLVSLAVVGVIWANIYDPFYGLLNTVLQNIGLGGWIRGWLSEPMLVLFSVNVASSWQGFGLYMLLFIAGLQNIDRSLYDAADVDGATAWQKLVHVTLPGLRDVMTFVISLALINGLKGFATVFVMTNGGPFYASEIITTYIYRLAFSAQDHGLAAVLCIMMSILAITITVTFNRWRARGAA